MKDQLEKIEQKKKQIVSNLKKLRNKYVASIYAGLIKQKSIKEIHKDIQKITTIFNNQGVIYTRNMQKYVINLANKSKKAVDGVIIGINNGKSNIIGLTQEDFNNPIDIIVASFLFKKFDKDKVFQKTNTISYDVGKKYESDFKEEVIRKEILKNRNLSHPKVFYLCSKHDDCAQDHLNYQGKFYIDEKWESIIKDDEEKRKIRAFIKANGIKTYQWVIHRPVWLITRPNCRHYFKSIKTDEVINKDINTIIKNHKLHNKVGKQIMATIRHPINEEWYTEGNVRDIIKKYEDRLEYHKSMWDVKKSQTTKRAIEKDRLLIRKWEDYLRKLRM